MLDIDGFRMDKTLQITLNSLVQFSKYVRACARRLGKDNFFIPGEIAGENGISSVYLGRGRRPDMRSPNVNSALTLAGFGNDSPFLRGDGDHAIDASAFHYDFYRSLTIFLGMDGNLTESGSRLFNWVDMWNEYLVTNDFTNANTGMFDPRHMWGVSNQDVFRWSSLRDGPQRMLLGLFLTTLLFPGIPLHSWGDEQAFYVFDNTHTNYMYGRQPMTSSIAWQLHGCYGLDSEQYYAMPVAAGRSGCRDDTISLDHRDPAHPIRLVIKIMHARRQQYPVLNDGWFLEERAICTNKICLFEWESRSTHRNGTMECCS